MNFNETEGFGKDLNRLTKKYRSLPDDLEEFKKVVAAVPLGSSKHFAVLHNQGGVRIVKARLFCRYLKGSSGLRVIYAYHEGMQSIAFIELYFKGEQLREDAMRIQRYLDRG
ncbi:MAG: hypothetical protein V2A66_01160 [Pseudomonadota bacterium]